VHVFCDLRVTQKVMARCLIIQQQVADDEAFGFNIR
jgi:hypothetical protein